VVPIKIKREKQTRLIQSVDVRQRGVVEYSEEKKDIIVAYRGNEKDREIIRDIGCWRKANII